MQIVIALVQLPQHVLAGKCINIAVPELFFDLLFGYYQQKFLIRQVLCAQSFEIQLGLFAGRFVFSNVQLIDIIVDLLRRFLKQLLPFFQQLRHPYVKLADHRSDSKNDQQDHHYDQKSRLQHLFIQLGQQRACVLLHQQIPRQVGYIAYDQIAFFIALHIARHPDVPIGFAVFPV